MIRDIIIIILLSILTNVLQSQDYQLNTAQSTMTWVGKAAFSSYTLSGTIKPKNGNLSMDSSQLRSVAVIVDMTTLDAENKQLKTHLRGEDFFDIKKFKTAEFRLKDIFPIHDVYNGTLLIKGIPIEYSFPIEIVRVKEGIKVTGVLLIDRTDFGITFNSPNYFEKLKDQAIADEFELSIDLYFDEMP